MILLFLIFLVLNLISPIIGVLFSFSVIFFQHKKKSFVQISLLNLAFFLGLINSLKVPESDLLNYMASYRLATNIDWLTYVFLYSKEPLFYFFVKLMNFVSFSNETFFIISFTILGYYILFYSLWKVHNYYKLDTSNFIFALFCTFLFPNLFALSAHLVRQFIASSIIIYFLINKFYYNKGSIFFLIIAFLFHSTSIVFIVCYMPFFKQKLTFKKGVLLLVVLIPAFLGIHKLLNLLLLVSSKVPLLSYVLQRATKSNMEVEPLSNLILLFNILILGVFYLISKKKNFGNLLNTNFRFFYLTVSLFVFILLNTNNGILAMRFSFYMYFFLPLGFYFLGELISGKVEVFLFQLLVSVIWGCWFVYKLQNGVWTYNNIYKIF